MSLNDRANAAIATLEANTAANTADTTRFGRFVNQATGYTTTLGQYIKSLIEWDFSLSQMATQFQLSLNAALAGFNATAAASEAQRQADYNSATADAQALLGTIYNCLDGHYTHPNTITSNSLVPADRNMLSAGVMTIAEGVTMTIAPDSYWRIV